MRVVAGIFVGGASRRMGGQPKGLLRVASGETIVERLRVLVAPLVDEVVVVGASSGYAALALPALEDDPAGVGPLGGLAALLRHAGPRAALVVACDMPHVSRALLVRLLDAVATEPIVAPRRAGRWEPLFARYHAPRVLPFVEERLARGERSLQGLLDDAGATALAISAEEERELDDWDTPEDVG